MPEFQPFPKIPRLSRTITITEKIDGTNASILIPEDGGPIIAGSRTRWITPIDDNYGFAKWVQSHEDELRTGLGFGHHFGEWWGQGIQRGYGLKEKRFSLFNVGKWNPINVPACCSVVPTLAISLFTDHIINATIESLHEKGSVAAPGFMQPEGIIIYHSAANSYFKKTLVKDEAFKGESAC